jgi:bacillithiol biosynthesis cysteine-adding enzyme BshC
MSGELSVKAHCLPFSQIPHTTRLFTDLLAYSPNVQPFYPRSPLFGEWLQSEAARISYDSSRREQVTAILERQNRSWNASSKALANLDRLRHGAAAVVTGQQVGLFGGPVFSVYKALTAVKLAEEATAAGIDAVPIFWLATYDHDLAEVNHVSLPGPEGSLETLTTPSHDVPGSPVSAVRFGPEITPVVEQAVALLGDSEAVQFLRGAYRSGETLGSAFARLYAHVFADWGVILLDASDAELARLSVPIYRAGVERAAELSSALVSRGEMLEKAGYHQQVKVTRSSVLLFTTRQGVRTPIHRREDRGTSEEFVIDGEAAAEKLSSAELISQIEAHPEQFSPNVLLRPILQDFLLPTLAYTGGAAEAAYFAQAGAVYEALLHRVTPIVPRFSATIVEPKIERLLERHRLPITAVFEGPESLHREMAARSLPADLQAAFDSAAKSFDSNFSVVKQKLESLDRTLVDAAETSRSKIQHQLEKLRSQAARAEAQKSEVVNRHADLLSEALYPGKGLQERSIGAIYFLARYGLDFVHQLHNLIQSDCHDHQIVEL